MAMVMAMRMQRQNNATDSHRMQRQNSATDSHRMQRQNSTIDSHTCICDLPHVVTSDILSRLPIDTVGHSMCVCKTWRDLVLDPQFAKLHLSRSSKSVSLLFPYPPDFLSGRNRMYMVDEQIKGGRLYCQKSILGRFDIYNFPLKMLDLLCSCNGMLLCMCRMEGNLYICNPIKSSEWVVLPRPSIQAMPVDSMFANYGFGFCSRSNQYKVIRVVTTGFPVLTSFNRAARCEMLVVGSDEWRCIKTAPIEQYCPDPAVGQIASPWIPLNGYLHLVVKAKVDQYHHNFFISRFKIYEEELEMLVPLPGCYSTFSTFSLGLLHDRLILLDVSDHYSQIGIWVMTDYGVKESWTKSLVIGSNSLGGFRNPSWLKPIKFSEDGELLMSYTGQSLGNRSTLFSYDTKTGKLRKHKLNCIEYYSRIDFVPSLVSPSDVARKRTNNRVDGESSQPVSGSV